MSLVYSDPASGHPRINQYIMSAMADRVLINHPLLHADVLRFKLDSSFAAGSQLYSKESRIADWERATARLPGEDVVTLAIRVTEAYIKKVSDPKVDTITVWESRSAANEIKERFNACLLDDPVSRERGLATTYELDTEWGKISHRVLQGDARRSDLSIITIATNHLQHCEAAAAGNCYDLADIDESASEASESCRPRRSTRTTGRGARARRAERRLTLAEPTH
jgi:hypothetical protein